MNTCRSCHAEIRWEKTPAGKRMPLDQDPHPDGNVRLGLIGGEKVALVLAGAELAAAQIAGPMYRTHFQTCPDAAEHRRGPSPRTSGGQPDKEPEQSAAT